MSIRPRDFVRLCLKVDVDTLRGTLEGVPGLGPVRIRALLRYFGSVDAIRAASLEEITRVPGIGPKTARLIQERLRG